MGLPLVLTTCGQEALSGPACQIVTRTLAVYAHSNVPCPNGGLCPDGYYESAFNWIAENGLAILNQIQWTHSAYVTFHLDTKTADPFLEQNGSSAGINSLAVTGNLQVDGLGRPLPDGTPA